MVKRVNVLASKPDKLNSIPIIHVAEGDKLFLKVVL